MEDAVNPIEQEITEGDGPQALQPQGQCGDGAKTLELPFGIQGLHANDDQRSQNRHREGKHGHADEPLGHDLVEHGVRQIQPQLLAARPAAPLVAENVFDNSKHEQQEQNADKDLNE